MKIFVAVFVIVLCPKLGRFQDNSTIDLKWEQYKVSISSGLIHPKFNDILGKIQQNVLWVSRRCAKISLGGEFGENSTAQRRGRERLALLLYK
jgi:hypothetical protein